MLHKCERPGCENKFSRRRVGHGRQRYCSKECAHFVRNKRYMHKIGEKHAAYQRAYKATLGGHQRYMFWSAKSRAKKKGLPFNLERNDIIIPETCPVLPWITLTLAPREETRLTTSPSLDRIKPELGYVKGNVRVISGRANMLKNNATVQELEAVLRDLKEHNE